MPNDSLRWINSEVVLRDLVAVVVVILGTSWIGYTTAVGAMSPPILTLLVGAASGYLFSARADSTDRLAVQRDAYAELAQRATLALEQAVNERLAGQGQPPFLVVPPAVPEHHSPPSQAQQDDADVQTLTARVDAAITGVMPNERSSG